MSGMVIRTPEYLAYVDAGGCPFTEGKTWCNGRADGHPVHWATRALQNGEHERVPLDHATIPTT